MKPEPYSNDFALKIFRSMFEAMAYPDIEQSEEEHDKLLEPESLDETS